MANEITELWNRGRKNLPDTGVFLYEKILFMSSRLSQFSSDPSIPWSIISVPLKKVWEQYRIKQLEYLLPQYLWNVPILKHRVVHYVYFLTHVIIFALRIWSFLESENCSSAGISSTSLKPLISVTPSARVLHLKKQAKIVSEIRFLLYRCSSWTIACLLKRTCKAPF